MSVVRHKGEEGIAYLTWSVGVSARGHKSQLECRRKSELLSGKQIMKENTVTCARQDFPPALHDCFTRGPQAGAS